MKLLYSLFLINLDSKTVVSKLLKNASIATSTQQPYIWSLQHTLLSDAHMTHCMPTAKRKQTLCTPTKIVNGLPLLHTDVRTASLYKF